MRITTDNFQDHLDTFHTCRAVRFVDDRTVVIDGVHCTIDEPEFVHRLELGQCIVKAAEAAATIRFRADMVRVNEAMDGLFEAFKIPTPDMDDRDIPPSDG